jgi:hypothetical protein
MPGFDGTGPRGFGPMTGWGRGYCAGQGGYFPARGWLGRFGGGRGRGWRNRYWSGGGPGWGYPGYHTGWFNADIPADEGIKILQEDEKHLEEELKNVRDELERLKKKEQK